MRLLLAWPLFKAADALIGLAKIVQVLGFMTLCGRNWRGERDRTYRHGLTQAHFQMNR